MKIERFEDLECWQEARNLCKMVYSNVGKGNFPKDYRLRDQITGASISVMNNIVEGFASQSNPEFIRFLSYARRSSSEVQTCLYVALDQKYIEENQFTVVYKQAGKCRMMIDGLRRYLVKQKAV